MPSSPAARSASTGSRIRQFAGHSLACTIWRTASVPASHVGNTMPAVARNVGRRWIAHPRLGDDAEDPLAADHQAVGAGPGARAREPAALPPALRREHPHRLDEVVDVGVVRRVVAARAGGDPAAERREAEALREVAQREAVRPQLVLERRPVDAGLDARGAGGRVDLEHAVEAVHGDGDDGVGVRRVDAPDHRRAGAERDDLDVAASSTSRAPPPARPRCAGGRRRRSGWGSAG